MTIVSITGNSPSTASTSLTIAVPSTGIQSGDQGLMWCQANSNVGTLTAPTGWTLLSQLGPLGGSNCETWLFQKNSAFSTSDMGTTLSASWSGTAPRWATGLAIVRNATFETPTAFSDNAADTTLTFGNFTPAHDSEDVLLIGGVSTTSAQGAYSLTLPTTPGAWTKDLDINGGYATTSNVGVFGAHLTLGTGTGGVAQSIGTGSATKALRFNAWAVPLTYAAPPPSSYRFVKSGAGTFYRVARTVI